MGYYTRHRLVVHAPKGEAVSESKLVGQIKNETDEVKIQALVDKLKKKPLTSGQIIAELRAYSEDAKYALSADGNTSNECKWYEHEDHLRIFSKRYPEVLFGLHGEGEESGDLWIQYYKNGKMQTCKVVMTYPPYDEKMLK
jgi:hypothetical protein